MDNYRIAVIPFSGLSPSACAALAVAIDDALEVFSRWGLPIGTNTRLQKAKKHLINVSEEGSYGSSSEDLYQTARAIQIANDFYVISRTLNKDKASPIAEELRIALKGSLAESKTKHKKELDIQSQFWFGTVLAHSGLHPAVPDSKTTRPDFLISLGTLLCGVEIKRPRSALSARRALYSAASQLHKYGNPGVIVLDLSQSVDADSLILYQGSLSARQIVAARFDPLANDLMDTVTSRLQRKKFSRIVVLVVFARFFSWTLGLKNDSDMGFLFRSTVIREGCAGLIVDESDRIQNLIAKGFKRIAGNRAFIRRRST